MKIKKEKYKTRSDGYKTTSVKVILENGKESRRLVYGKTDSEVDKKVLEAKQRYESGLVKISKKDTFARLSDVWLSNKKCMLQSKTFYEYNRIVGKELLPYIGIKPIANLRKQHLQDILNSLADKGLALKIIKKVKYVTFQILDLALDNELLIRNAFSRAKLPNAPETERLPITELDYFMLTETWKYHRMGFSAMLMLYCGIRRGELLALRKGDLVQYDDQFFLRVNKAIAFDGNAPYLKSPKSKAGFRDIPIPQPLYEAALAQLTTGHIKDLICPSIKSNSHMSQISYFRAWSSYMTFLKREFQRYKNNYPDEAFNGFTAHQLRHTYATVIVSSGISLDMAMELTGHSDTRTLMRYVHSTKRKRLGAIPILNSQMSNIIDKYKQIL